MAIAPERPPVTIAVLAAEDRRRTKDLLGALNPQLRTGDNVVLLGTGRSSQRLSAWRERRTNGTLERSRALPRVADYLLFVDALITPSRDLITILLEGASDGVGVVAPRSNFGDGDQRCTEVPYGRADIGVKRAFLRDIGASLPHRFTPASLLGGPCVLLRRDLALARNSLDDFASPTTISAALQRMHSEGEVLLIAENAFADHPEGALQDAPLLISAALIVKDEERQLPTCLRAASALADELVVYDTGSTDGTVEIARRAGANVFEGYWDDDFARARNEALERCRGEWILWIDADEILQCPNPAAVRALLSASASTLDAYLVPIDNLQGTEAGTVMTHPAARLFRRATCQWEGRLHEQIVTRHTKQLINVAMQDLARIKHRGYLQHALRERDKAQRNLRTAFGDLTGGSDLDLATRTLSLARSYMLASRFDEGCELCTRVLELAERPSTKRLALRALADGLLSLGRFDEALNVSAQIKELTTQPFHGYIVEGHARLGRGEPELALAAFDHVTGGRDDDGFEYGPSLIAVARAKALIALEQHSQAADTLLDVLRSSDGIDLHIANLIQLLRASARDVCEILEALRPERRIAFVPQIIQLPPTEADEVLEAWYRSDPASLPILAAAAQVALGLAVDRQLVWSARLRGAGLWTSCPLIGSAIDECRPAHTRALASAVAFHSFGDERARSAYHAAALSTAREDWPTLLEQISAISPLLGAESRSFEPPRRSPPRVISPIDPRVMLVISTYVAHLDAIDFAASAATNGDEVTLVQPAPWEPVHHLLAPLGVSVRCWEEGPIPNSEAAFRSAARLYADRPYDTVVLTSDLASLTERFCRLFPIASVVALEDDSSAHNLDVGLLFGDFSSTPDELRRGVVVVLDPSWRDDFAPDQLAITLGSLIPPDFRAHPLTILAGAHTDPLRQELPHAMFVGPVANPTPWLRTGAILVLLTRQHRRSWLALATTCGIPAISCPIVESEPSSSSHAAASRQLPPQMHSRDNKSKPPPMHGDIAPADPSSLAELVDSSPRGALSGSASSTANMIHWSGAIYSLDSLAQVNRELVRELANEYRGQLKVFTPEAQSTKTEVLASLRGIDVQHRSRPPSGGALEVRHQWPPDFTPSSARRLVLIQPWEFGCFPAEWIGPVRDVVDELWVPTSWVKQCAIESGVASSKVHVVPNGIDTLRFSPEGSPYPLRTKKNVRFLFVGGCIQRKGIDILLETYLTTFTRDDDVCLVVKPFGSQTVYRNMTLEDDLRRAANGSGAELEIVEGDLGGDQMAALYRACTALVHPYRGEGFGLPIAEAMASGIATIVTNGGAALDFCNERTSWLISARRVPTSVPELTPTNSGWWWFEPKRQELAAALRAVANDREEARLRGTRGRQRILTGFTTTHAGAIASERIGHLLNSDVPAALIGKSTARP